MSEEISQDGGELSEYREMAADVIDDVLSVIEDLYPELKPLDEFLAETPDASLIYGTVYFDLECIIEDKLREEFVVRKQGLIKRIKSRLSSLFFKGD